MTETLINHAGEAWGVVDFLTFLKGIIPTAVYGKTFNFLILAFF